LDVLIKVLTCPLGHEMQSSGKPGVLGLLYHRNAFGGWCEVYAAEADVACALN